MATANRDLSNAAVLDPWNLRDLLFVGIGFPAFLGVMFFLFFFGLGNMN